MVGSKMIDTEEDYVRKKLFGAIIQLHKLKDPKKKLALSRKIVYWQGRWKALQNKAEKTSLE